jgi:hypothetical protein
MVIEITNVTNSDVYVQRATNLRSDPYPVYLQRWQAPDVWEDVAPCVDLPPAGNMVLRRNTPVRVDLVYSLDLPSTCKTRRIDPSGKYRWRIEYFLKKGDLEKYETTNGRSGKAFSAVSQPFSIKPIR